MSPKRRPPSKKRKTSAAAAAAAAAAVAEAAETAVVNDSNNAAPAPPSLHMMIPNLDEIFHDCIDHESSDHRHVSASLHEQQGLVATTLWPFLLQHAAVAAVTKTTTSAATLSAVQKASRLVAVLVSFAHSTAGKKAQQALECMLLLKTTKSSSDTTAVVVVEAAWKRLLETLYDNNQTMLNNASPSTASEWEYMASLVHFLTLACEVSQSRSFSSSSLNLQKLLEPYNGSSVSTLQSLSERQRELLLRQQQHGEGDPASTSTTTTNTPCFVVRLVRQILHMVQGDAFKLGTIHYHTSQQGDNNDGDDDGRRIQYKYGGKNEDEYAGIEEDDEEEEEKERRKGDEDDDEDKIINVSMSGRAMNNNETSNTKTTSSTVFYQYLFLHRSLELLLDLLLTLHTRHYLQLYLEGVQFGIQCRRALGVPSVTSFVHANEQLFLAQQLLARIQTTLAVPSIHIHNTETTTTTTNSISIRMANRVEQVALVHGRATVLQKMCHRHYPHELADLIYASVGLLCSTTSSSSYNNNSNIHNSYLASALGALDDAQLLDLVQSKLRLIGEPQDATTTKNSGAGPETYSRDFLLQVLQEHLTIPNNNSSSSSIPLYPTERLLWDFARIPPSLPSLVPTAVLACAKLQTQFLSAADYLERTFELMQLSSAYDIRADLTSAVARVKPVVTANCHPDDDYEYEEEQQQVKKNPNKSQLQTTFTGWARMALELDRALELKLVAKPLLGQSHPSKVLADIFVDLQACGHAIRSEWDALSEHDNLFLVAIDASRATTNEPPPLLSEYHLHHGNRLRRDGDKDRRVPDADDRTFPQRHGVVLVRGCMIVHVRDEEGNILNTNINMNNNTEQPADESAKKKQRGTKRIFRVEMDPAQYALDAKGGAGATDLYRSFNLVFRREGRENNFKAVLETIRGLMAGDAAGSIGRVIPFWLQPLLLGQGNPAAAHYKSETMRAYAKNTVGVANPDDPLDFGDTFVDEAHLCSSFPNVIVDGQQQLSAATTKTSSKDENNKDDSDSPRKNYRVRTLEKNGGQTVVEATSYAFLENVAGNPVPFTPVQVEAIRSGLSPGLTVVVGPPGTGKTDVAVQIIACLFHSFPTQRTIVITHSNAALNDIFQKVMARGDVDERCLVRLGVGERDLQTDSTHDFTKLGRVAFSLERRGTLLEQVQLLSESLGISGKAERGADGSPSYTCETALYFNEHHVQKLIRSFERRARQETGDEQTNAASFFPFAMYFKIGEAPLTLSQARNYFAKLKATFDELTEYRPFELLRSQRQRTDYLIMKQARVVAMTCTHAAIARSHLIELGFEYDNVVVEEAGQMTDIEAFIPLLLQKGQAEESGSSGLSRLKRICLMGDHNQLPPVIKNMSFALYSNLDQSLFSRLIGFGVPHVQLDKQGRARPEIADLYSWRYDNLGNLDHVSQASSYRLANPGFVYTFQAINVDTFQGKGESTPTAYFFQNVGEAEYAVALFQYMVLIGYPPHKISILTTYNGQKALISDILSQRCGPGTPLAGVQPRAISTVDQYQGQQNDYILLSLVRTESVGHLRDIRRLVVAVSRARLGLYVICRQDLFAASHDLKRTFDQFASRPSKLHLVLGETFPTERLSASGSDHIPKGKHFEVDDVSHLGSLVHQMQEDWMQSHSIK